MGGYEIIEHTADVGFRARGSTLAELFRQSTHALLAINGATIQRESGHDIVIRVDARDLGGLLVEWLSEVLYELEAGDGLVTQVRVASVTDTEAQGSIRLAPRVDGVAGTHVKAITYHQLRVERADSGWVAEVYVDV